MPSASRRLCVVMNELTSDDTRANFFRTFNAYGAIEDIVFEEDRQYCTCTTRIQYHCLSSAEKLYNDALQLGMSWHLTYEKAVLHVGTSLLFSSPKPLDLFFLRSLFSTNDGNAAPLLVEKSMSTPGAGYLQPMGSSFTPNTDGAFWRRPFEDAISVVSSRSIGSFVGMCTFNSPHEATAFLSSHQLALAKSERSIFVTHVGPETGPLAVALTRLLNRHRVENLVDGMTLVGIVVREMPSGSCDTDSGVFRDSDGKSPFILRTQTNFLKVSEGDRVEVKVINSDLSSSSLASGSSLEGVARASLIKVVATARRTFVRGGPSITPGTTVPNSTFRGRGHSFRGGGHFGQRGGFGNMQMNRNVPLDNKTLAGKLFRKIQEKKNAATSGVENQELPCQYPPGFAAYQKVQVSVRKIADDGIHAVTVSKGDHTPVFIPDFLIPEENGVDWRNYAVLGERMFVTILYAVAIGDSLATIKLIASKRESEMLASVLSDSGPNPEQNITAGNDEKFISGVTFSAKKGILVTDKFIGLQQVSSGCHFLIIPDPGEWYPKLHTIPLFWECLDLNEDQSPEGGPSLESKRPIPDKLIIDEVVHDPRRGHFGVALSLEAYEAKLEAQEEERIKREREEEDAIQQLLAKALGNDFCADPPKSVEEDEQPQKKMKSES